MLLWRTYILPRLEYASSIWFPYYKKDVDLIENVQRRYTKFLPGMFHKSYKERRDALKIITLEERRIHLDLILLYKIVHNLIDIDFDSYFSYCTNQTRGHQFKLNINSVSRLNCHKFHFFNRIIKIWNALPDDIVMSNKVDEFKNKVIYFNVEIYCIGRALT